MSQTSPKHHGVITSIKGIENLLTLSTALIATMNRFKSAIPQHLSSASFHTVKRRSTKFQALSRVARAMLKLSPLPDSLPEGGRERYHANLKVGMAARRKRRIEGCTTRTGFGWGLSLTGRSEAAGTCIRCRSVAFESQIKPLGSDV